MYLYDKWSQVQCFYAIAFGFGGDYLTVLSYYFFIVFFIFLRNLAIDWDTQDIMFLMINDILLSIFKSTLAMLATFGFVRYITQNKSIAVLTSYLFVISPLYFRFTVYWPFFSDIFILLPLLLWSIELF